jgi:ATP-dependent Clp protease protease subunit
MTEVFTMNFFFSCFISFLIVLSAALPLRAQTEPAAADQGAAKRVQGQSAEQSELGKLTTENLLEDQKNQKKLKQLNGEKDALAAQYELDMQKQKSKVSELEAELYRVGTENKLSAEKQLKAVSELQAQLDKVTLDNKLADEKRKAEIAALETEYETLLAQNKLMAEQSAAKLFKQNDELQKLGLDNKISEEKNKKAIYLISQKLDNLRAENDLKAEQQRELLMADNKERNDIDMGVKRLDLEERRLKIEKMVMDSRMDLLKSDLEMRDRKAEWKKEANKEPVYLDKPFSNKKLVISDRRISMNGPIFDGVADYVSQRIHYYNNISSSPVFIVIDYCPGGSVMEGYRILKAMQASRAPVYVVVKSFAASMAATITTLADKSYVYPNAIILHHQMSTMNWGNMTQLKEQLELAKEWERRLAVPVAKKMGITLDDFRKKMYEKNSDGDWEEFGDKAVNYNWATSVVDEIDETGFIKNPDAVETPAKPVFTLDEKTDEKGQRYVTLPRLQPFDFYYIYNPDRYYR